MEAVLDANLMERRTTNRRDSVDRRGHMPDVDPAITCPKCSQLGHPSGGLFCKTCQATIDSFDTSHTGHNLMHFPKCFACGGTGKIEDAMRRKMLGQWRE